MEPVFSLPYSEFEAILQFARVLKKQDGFAVFIPVSRQQEGVDFLVVNHRTGRSLRVQVKSSRAYVWRTAPHLRFWYNNFAQRYRRRAVDIYVFTALYPVYTVGRDVRERRRFWKTAVLVFRDDEIAHLLPRIRSKNGNPDRFFQFGFDIMRRPMPDRITVTRGQLQGRDLTGHLLENRAEDLRKALRGRRTP